MIAASYVTMLGNTRTKRSMENIRSSRSKVSRSYIVRNYRIRIDMYKLHESHVTLKRMIITFEKKRIELSGNSY